MSSPTCHKCGELMRAEMGVVPIWRCSCGYEIPRTGAKPVESEQLGLLPGRKPEQVIRNAEREHGPFVARVCLFSGGNDSTVVAHRCRDHYDTLAFIDTGTAVPGVREFVEQFAASLGKPLRFYESGGEYRRMVLEHGFPGPAQHGRAYIRLKERQLEALKRDLKKGHPRSARVLYLTGVRRDESKRRSRRSEITRTGATVFCNPLIDWTNSQMHRYRAEHELPQSDVAALIHRSGECNCGAFAAPGEREMMQSLWPDWFEKTIASLEREAKAQGIAACEWGKAPPAQLPDEVGPLCSDCQLRLEVQEAA